MKKVLTYVFPALFLCYLMFLGGMYYGRWNSDAIHLKHQEEAGTGLVVGNGKIDVNRVTVKQLCYIPGVGETTAQKIVSYREENGPYKSMDDLLNIDGIGPKKLAELSIYLGVGGNYEDTGN